MEKSNIRGASNTTIITIFAVIAGIFFLVIRIGPILWNEKSLQSGLDHMAVEDILKMQQGEIVDSVIRAGQDAGVTLTEENISVEYGPEENRVTIKVHYTAEADLIITQYTRDVEIVSNPIGSPTENRARHEVGAPAPPPPPSAPPASPGPAPSPAGPYPGRARDVGNKFRTPEP